MSQGLYVLVKFVGIFLDVILIAFLARALLSWITIGDGESRIGTILYCITEPFIVPVRLLCDRFGWFAGLPLDMPFMISSLILAIISMFIGGMG